MLETRLLVAYGLIALIVLVGTSWCLIRLPRRRAHKLRMRGIKTQPVSNRESRERAAR